MSISSRHSLCSLAAARVAFLNVSRDVLWSAVRWIRPQNIITSIAGEKLGALLGASKKESEKKSLSTSFIRYFFCGRCDAVSEIASHEPQQIVAPGAGRIVAAAC